MRKLESILSIVAMGLVSGVASAQPKEEAAKPVAAAEPVKAPEGPPKPAPEMAQYKMLLGNWKCTGKMSMMGKEAETSGTYKAAVAHNGFWVVAQMTSSAKGMPGKYTGTDIYGWDPQQKQYVMYSIDNMGGSGAMMSKGWEGDKQEWTGKAQMMGQMMDMKQTVTKKSDKETAITGDGGGMHYEMTCKK